MHFVYNLFKERGTNTVGLELSRVFVNYVSIVHAYTMDQYYVFHPKCVVVSKCSLSAGVSTDGK